SFNQRVRSVQLVGKNLRKIRWENGWEMRGHGWGTLSPDLVLPTWSLFLPLPCLYMRCGDQHLACKLNSVAVESLLTLRFHVGMEDRHRLSRRLTMARLPPMFKVFTSPAG